MTQGHGNDLFGRGNSRSDGADPRAEVTPNESRMKDGKDLEQTLSDDAGLEMTMVGADFASDLLAIEIAFVVEMLVAGTPGNGRHGLHPKMIPISADGMDGLFEGDFDFEARAIKGDDLQRVEGEVGGEKNPATSVRMDDGDEAYEATDGTPEQVNAAIGEIHPVFPIDRTGCLGESLSVLK